MRKPEEKPKKKEKKRTNKLKKKDRSKKKSTNENYIMYNVYIIYMYRKTSGMKIKIKEEKKEQETAPHTYRTRI